MSCWGCLILLPLTCMWLHKYPDAKWSWTSAWYLTPVLPRSRHQHLLLFQMRKSAQINEMLYINLQIVIWCTWHVHGLQTHSIPTFYSGNWAGIANFKVNYCYWDISLKPQMSTLGQHQKKKPGITKVSFSLPWGPKSSFTNFFAIRIIMVEIV